MSDSLLRLYLDPAEIGLDGYPHAWHGRTRVPHPAGGWVWGEKVLAIKDHVRARAGNRCDRCLHPFIVGETPGEWSPCDENCSHGGPICAEPGNAYTHPAAIAGQIVSMGLPVLAQWRVLTVHHLNGVKHDCRWWNLASLCQRCHLLIQAKVWMDRPWTREHSEWFKPHAAGYYAWRFLGQELDRKETLARLDELLALEDRQLELGG